MSTPRPLPAPKSDFIGLEAHSSAIDQGVSAIHYAGELIHYIRPEQTGPKRSIYSLVQTDAPDALRDLLESSLGTLGEVRKRRWLHLVGQTRIHLDEVTGLVEWPVPLLGTIDAQFMDVPAEVLIVSMKVHLRF